MGLGIPGSGGLDAWVVGAQQLPVTPDLSFLFCRVPWAQSRVGDPRHHAVPNLEGLHVPPPRAAPRAAPSPCPCPLAGSGLSPGPLPRVQRKGCDGLGSGDHLSSPSPAEKVSSSPMKVVEGTDMMKAGGYLLPGEQLSLPAPSPPRCSRHRRSMPFHAPGTEHRLFAIRAFVFASTPRLVRGSGPPHAPHLCSGFILCLLLCLRLLGCQGGGAGSGLGEAQSPGRAHLGSSEQSVTKPR